MTTSPYFTDDLELLKEIQIAAEARLAAQLTAALASDQRALVFAGLAAASAAALVGGAATLLSSASPDTYLCRAAIGTALGLLLAVICAVIAAWATPWYFPGGKPQSWLSDISGKKGQTERLAALAEDYNDRISANDTVMSINAMWLNGAGAIATLSICAGGTSLVLKYSSVFF